jgi:RNA polymerase sigma-70 factor (ECF subfamily)
MTPPLRTRRPTDTPESELISRARDGDVAAFEQLTDAHADRLYSTVLRLIGNRSDAEDVVQETLLRAWRGIGRFQGRSMYFTWLYRIAINEANRALEKRSRRGMSVTIEDEGLQPPTPQRKSPAEQAEQRELRSALDRAIADLAPVHRTALVLRDVEGLSTCEAAEIVDIGEAAFKSRLHQARLKVRTALGDETLIAASP